MTSYFTAAFSAADGVPPATYGAPVQLCSAADHDRRVFVGSLYFTGMDWENYPILLGYDDTTLVYPPRDVFGQSHISFVLPAGKELWGALASDGSGDPQEIQIAVTPVRTRHGQSGPASDFSCSSTALSASTDTQLATSCDQDRVVYQDDQYPSLRFGFDSTSIAVYGSTVPNGFVLPAGKELWANCTNSVTVSIFLARS